MSDTKLSFKTFLLSLFGRLLVSSSIDLSSFNPFSLLVSLRVDLLSRVTIKFEHVCRLDFFVSLDGLETLLNLKLFLALVTIFFSNEQFLFKDLVQKTLVWPVDYLIKAFYRTISCIMDNIPLLIYYRIPSEVF